MGDTRTREPRPWVRCGAALVVVTVALSLCSCGLDSGFDAVSDFDVVITLYDPDVDFGGFTTYAMPDSVVHLDILSRDLGAGAAIGRSHDDVILDEIAANLDAIGYVRETDVETNGADIVVLVAVTSTEWEAWVSYPWYDYWYWYPGWDYWGWYGPGYGYDYPPCYNCGYVESFSTGTLLIDMVDANTPDQDEETVPVIWACGVNGLLEDSSHGIELRIVDGVEQAFAQSPYLGAD